MTETTQSPTRPPVTTYFVPWLASLPDALLEKHADWCGSRTAFTVFTFHAYFIWILSAPPASSAKGAEVGTGACGYEQRVRYPAIFRPTQGGDERRAARADFQLRRDQGRWETAQSVCTEGAARREHVQWCEQLQIVIFHKVRNTNVQTA